jgi:hypothetical protein
MFTARQEPGHNRVYLSPAMFLGHFFALDLSDPLSIEREPIGRELIGFEPIGLSWHMTRND